MVTVRGHPGENNVITCYPDTYTPVNTFPQCRAENCGANKPGFFQNEGSYL